MGIKSNFLPFLREKCPEAFETIHISDFAYKKVAIDVSLYLHKYKAVNSENWISSFYSLISILRKNDVHCVFIFDGQAPPEKLLEQNDRKEKKEKLFTDSKIIEKEIEIYKKTGVISPFIKGMWERKRSPDETLITKGQKIFDIYWVEKKLEQKKGQIIDIGPKDHDMIKEMLTLLCIPFYTAPCEAEKLCSKLCIDGLVDGVLSEDSDIIAYGTETFITKMNSFTGTCVKISYSKILEVLSLTKEEFLDFCILCGTDYNKNMQGIGSKYSYSLIKKHHDIENISTQYDISCLNHVKVRSLFRDHTNFKEEIPLCGIPDFELFQKFVKDNNISVNIETTRQCFFADIEIL